MEAVISHISFVLPEMALRNEDLAAEYPGWTVEKIAATTGFEESRLAAAGECASDLAVKAANSLFNEFTITPQSIDYVVLCTQSPDYLLPATACLIQDRLGIPVTTGAFDFNQGCSGYVVGLGIAKGLIETEQARRVLFLTAETYSKYINPGDRSIRTLFGDAAAATLIEASSTNGEHPGIGPFVFGTDGNGAPNLIVPRGGMRAPMLADPVIQVDAQGNIRTENDLRMNGAEIFNFTLRTIPNVVQDLLRKGGLELKDIDLFVFHQANQYMLDHLRKKIGIPEAKFFIHLKNCGNTVSSTIPIALRAAVDEGLLKPGFRVMVVGFGVGYSWAAALLSWR